MGSFSFYILFLMRVFLFSSCWIHSASRHYKMTSSPLDSFFSFSFSKTVVNGIVHDVNMVQKGMRLVAMLVNSNGLYKINRLFLNPDGFFFRVHILVVDALYCSRPCPDFKLGNMLFPFILFVQVTYRGGRMEVVPIQFIWKKWAQWS